MSETGELSVGQPNSGVVFDTVKYDVIAGPDDATPLVRLVRAAVLQTLDMDRLVNHLNRTDDLLYIAACGVAGFVHPKTNASLSAQVMGLQYKLRTNTGAMTSALLSLGESARSMLVVVRAAFKDFYNLHEADAVTRLARCESVAIQMAENAGKLEGSFQSLVEAAGELLRLTSETRNLQKQERLPTQPLKLEMNAWDESIKAKRDALELQMRKIHELREEVKAGQVTAGERVFTQAIVSQIAIAFGGEILGELAHKMASLESSSELAAALAETRTTYHVQKEIETETTSEDAQLPTEDAKREAYANEKAKYLDMLMDLQTQEREALDAIVQTARELGSAKDEEEVVEAAVVSLRHAVVTLKQIVVILAEHKWIWTQMAMDGARLAQADLQTDIEGRMQKPREERIEAYTKPGFQVYMLTIAAQWQALQRVAMEYRSIIQTVYAKMGQTYTKSPTIEEARQLAPLLGTALAREVTAEIRFLNEPAGQMAVEQQEQATVLDQAAPGGHPVAPGV